MKVVILAGGKGTRLKPYTITIPKPLVPIGKFSILEIVIRQLKKYGFEDIILTVNHMSELIKAYFKDGKKFGVKIEYSIEKKLLGTAGPLSLIGDISEEFLVINGDILTNLDFSKLVDYHKRGTQIATLVTFKKKVPINLGVLEIGRDRTVRKYIEKPSLSYNASTGIYVFNKRVLSYIKKNRHFDLPELVKLLIKKGIDVKVYEFGGLWFDIGTPSDYEEAIQTFKKNRSMFLQKDKKII
ncbi:MAG: NTP transferase domain-containing protein [Candidatus Omnitrophica bacterium]|nr:NTP transferase domain-containing protein [Candidatus Omnitrophota bacterium]